MSFEPSWHVFRPWWRETTENSTSETHNIDVKKKTLPKHNNVDYNGIALEKNRVRHEKKNIQKLRKSDNQQRTKQHLHTAEKNASLTLKAPKKLKHPNIPYYSSVDTPLKSVASGIEGNPVPMTKLQNVRSKDEQEAFSKKKPWAISKPSTIKGDVRAEIYSKYFAAKNAALPTVPVKIGTPPRKLFLQISMDLPGIRLFDGAYNISGSRSAQKSSSADIKQKDMAAIDDIVHIGGISLSRLRIDFMPRLHSDPQDAMDGFLGLGLAPPTHDSNSSFLDILAKNAVIERAAFAMINVGTGNRQKRELLLGSIRMDRIMFESFSWLHLTPGHKQTLVWAAKARATVVRRPYQEADRLSGGQTSVIHPSVETAPVNYWTKETPVRFSSTDLFLSVPFPEYENLLAVLVTPEAKRFCWTAPESKLLHCPCSAATYLNSFVLTFGALNASRQEVGALQSVMMKPQDYVLEIMKRPQSWKFKNKNNETIPMWTNNTVVLRPLAERRLGLSEKDLLSSVCVVGIAPLKSVNDESMSSTFWILGDIFLRNVDIVFDSGLKTIGLRYKYKTENNFDRLRVAEGLQNTAVSVRPTQGYYSSWNISKNYFGLLKGSHGTDATHESKKLSVAPLDFWLQESAFLPETVDNPQLLWQNLKVCIILSGLVCLCFWFLKRCWNYKTTREENHPSGLFVRLLSNENRGSASYYEDHPGGNINLA